MKRYFCLLIILIAPFAGKSQDFEAGVFLGVSNYQGDLAPDIVWHESHPAFGIMAKYNASPYFSFSIGGNYGKISGNDTNNASTKLRNLSFSTNIYELTSQVEFNFYRFGIGLRPKRITPYVFTGLSVFYFNPETVYNGETFTLRLYTTEGQGFKDGQPNSYGNWQFAIPVGGGVKINCGPNWNILVHASYRLTFTNYLDDVGGQYADKKQLIEDAGKMSAILSDRSGERNDRYLGYAGRQRGNSDKYDSYIFTGVTITRIIPNKICPSIFN